ncbi:MAG: phytanoyl-CoA dioxygenase family protein [Thiolinea sp.]
MKPGNDDATYIGNYAEPVAVRVNPDGSLPEAARDALDQDGVVAIRKAIPTQWLDVVEQGIEQALSGASTNVDVVRREGDAGSFSFSSGAWQSVEPFRRFIFDSPMPDLAWNLLGSKRLGLFYDFLLLKQPLSNNAATPWHQDHSYYPLDGRQLINCWVALDDIPLESALRFIKGSHRPGHLYRAIDFDNPARDYRHARMELPLPPNAETPVDAEILSTALKAGDMLAWTSYTLHSAPGNHLNRRRAAFSVNWLGDDVVFNGKPSLESYRDPGQIVGQAIICEKFPLVREAK